MRSRLLPVLLLAGLVVGLATGCSRVPSNEPESYTATLPNGSEPTTEEDFVQACTEALQDGGAEGEALLSSDYCGCFYQKIEDEIPFAEFQSDDAALAADPEDVPPEYEAFADECSNPGSSEGGGGAAGGDGTTTTAGEAPTTAPPTTGG